MTTHPEQRPTPTMGSALTIETHGIDVIPEQARRGRPLDMFWPWCAGNITLLQVAWGAYLLEYGISFTQALLVSFIGVVVSFFMVGLISLVGMRGSAPTMVLSRAVYGVRGNFPAGLIGYLLMLGWEIVNVSTAVLASGTIASRLGADPGTAKVIAFVVVAGLVIALGVLGFDAVMRAQKWLSWLTLAMTGIFMALTAHMIHPSVLGSHPSGNGYAVVGATIMVFCAFGAGWFTGAADYSRYLPRSSSRPAIVGWTTAGGSLPVVLLIGYGLLLVGSNPDLMEKMAADPIGTLAALAPLWFMVPFWLFAMAGQVAGATLDLYSSGLCLLAIGLPVKRWQAAAIDGVLMTIGAIYVVWFALDFMGPFTGFLITLGVPEAAWAGIFLADLVMVRWRAGYDQRKLFDPSSQGYGSVKWVPLVLLLACCGLGFGLVTNGYAGWLAWQGYLLGPLGFGGTDGVWAHTSIGVLIALVVSFVAYLPLARRVAGVR
ncbi:purine-cytosine permease family protein [Luteococcus japonicus]|uniref:Cytosine/purine/uracil/thiamine/allantoin permease family protein n=1 Tax=Luteococcus japonicus LSP_Lj1 TaxID=1255658 RepID=A0A1R4KC19_9ACTN|nr:cytosine permease [Luteococcus japonicus]SJN41837.1 Cytosine/purine/uracil/thiamine/allantoin permease family protein [Luteococcus japonicus LSP_Lj1]